MENNELIIWGIAGLFGLCLIALNAYGIKKQGEALAMFAPLAQYAIERLDAQLVRYGEQLAPVHTAVVAAQTMLDEPTDPLAQTLPASFVNAVNAALEHMETLTDGQPLEAIK
jgi:hypothetical protein